MQWNCTNFTTHQMHFGSIGSQVYSHTMPTDFFVLGMESKYVTPFDQLGDLQQKNTEMETAMRKQLDDLVEQRNLIDCLGAQLSQYGECEDTF